MYHFEPRAAAPQFFLLCRLSEGAMHASAFDGEDRMLNSTFQFFGPIFGGPFFGKNVSSPDPPNPTFGWISFNNFDAHLRRADNEVTVDLDPLIGANFSSLITKMFKGHPEITLTGGPFAQIALWLQVPYFLGRILAHPLTTTLLRVYIDVHIKTPWYISDADGTISFYVFLRLQGGKLKADVDGAWVSLNGGSPDGQAVADQVGAVVQQAIPSVQSGLNAAIAPFSGATFKALYLIPGTGAKTSITFGDAALDAALGVVP